MKINKIICDVCSSEINLEKEPAIGSFQTIEVRTDFTFNGSKGQPDEQFSKIEYDLCKKCSAKVSDFIKENKK